MDINAFNRFCVAGWGKSGVALCDLLLSLKKEVRVSEAKERDSFSPVIIDGYQAKGVNFEFGVHSEKFIKGSQLMILSPGLDTENSQATKIARTLNIPYVGELELSFWLNKAKIVAITGTNGKTTTTYLTHKVLADKRKRVFLGGNIGTPFSSFVLDTKKGDIVVLEVSSFQLETIIEFKPYIAAVLNIEPDHLDRYPDFTAYLRAKLNIFKNQDAKDYALINKNISIRSIIEKEIRSKVIHFSDEFPDDNLSCVYRIASIFGIGKTDCLKVFSQFQGLPHRLQFVRKIRGITFINDSKATNPSSTKWAIRNINTPIILLAGGKDKGLDYSSILPYLKRVKKINLFGQAALKIKEALDSKTDTQVFSSLEEALLYSFNSADSGDTVLLSPMCASFDAFKNYEERGSEFIRLVNDLKD